MNLQIGKAVCFELRNNLVKSGNLAAREFVCARIFRRSKVRADTGEPQDAARTNTLREVEHLLWRYAQAVHSSVNF